MNHSAGALAKLIPINNPNYQRVKTGSRDTRTDKCRQPNLRVCLFSDMITTLVGYLGIKPSSGESLEEVFVKTLENI
jgi:hypothetical protein